MLWIAGQIICFITVFAIVSWWLGRLQRSRPAPDDGPALELPSEYELSPLEGEVAVMLFQTFRRRTGVDATTDAAGSARIVAASREAARSLQAGAEAHVRIDLVLTTPDGPKGLDVVIERTRRRRRR